MSTWADAEDADSWAADQARVAEWATQRHIPAVLRDDELHLIRKRCEEGTDVLAVADRRHLLAEVDRLRAQASAEQSKTKRGPLTIHVNEPGPPRLVPVRVPCPRCGLR